MGLDGIFYSELTKIRTGDEAADSTNRARPYWFLLIHYILIDMRVGYTCLNDISHCIFMGFGMEHFTLH
ncbi:Uncharacterised protein [Neisseria meningitidis]|nr:Uncharacterised protein [Neisseria meningitidis]